MIPSGGLKKMGRTCDEARVDPFPSDAALKNCVTQSVYYASIQVLRPPPHSRSLTSPPLRGSLARSIQSYSRIVVAPFFALRMMMTIMTMITLLRLRPSVRRKSSGGARPLVPRKKEREAIAAALPRMHEIRIIKFVKKERDIRS